MGWNNFKASDLAGGYYPTVKSSLHLEKGSHFYIGIFYRGGARGGLGATAPLRSMLAPRRKVKSDFFGDSGHL